MNFLFFLSVSAGLIDSLPSREIQDAIPVPLTLNNGEEIWRKRIELWLCNLDIILDSVTIQVRPSSHCPLPPAPLPRPPRGDSSQTMNLSC